MPNISRSSRSGAGRRPGQHALVVAVALVVAASLLAIFRVMPTGARSDRAPAYPSQGLAAPTASSATGLVVLAGTIPARTPTARKRVPRAVTGAPATGAGRPGSDVGDGAVSALASSPARTPRRPVTPPGSSGDGGPGTSTRAGQRTAPAGSRVPTGRAPASSAVTAAPAAAPFRFDRITTVPHCTDLHGAGGPEGSAAVVVFIEENGLYYYEQPVRFDPTTGRWTASRVTVGLPTDRGPLFTLYAVGVTDTERAELATHDGAPYTVDPLPGPVLDSLPVSRAGPDNACP